MLSGTGTTSTSVAASSNNYTSSQTATTTYTSENQGGFTGSSASGIATYASTNSTSLTASEETCFSASSNNGNASGLLASTSNPSTCTTYASTTTYSPNNTSVTSTQTQTYGAVNTSTEDYGAADYLGGSLDYSSSTTATPSSTDVLRSSTINGVAVTNDQNSQHGSTSTTVTSSSTSTSPGVYVTISFTATETAPWSQSTNTATTYGSMGNVVTSNQVFSNSNGEYYSFTRAYAQSTGLSNSATVTYSDAPTDTGYTYSMSESNSGTRSSGTGLTLSTSANFSIGQSSSQSITRDYNLTQSWYGPSSTSISNISTFSSDSYTDAYTDSGTQSGWGPSGTSVSDTPSFTGSYTHSGWSSTTASSSYTMVSSYFNPLTGMTVTSTTSFSTSTVYADSDSRVDTDTDTDSLDSDNDGGSITSSFSSMTSAGGVSALTFGTSYSAWSMSDSESPTAGSSDDDTWGNSTITFQETGGSPTVSSASFNVTYNNTLSAGIVTVPAAASTWLLKVQEYEGAVGTAGSSGSGSSSSSSGSSGATSSASAGSSGSSGSSSSSSSSSSGTGSSSSSSSSSAPGATGNAPAAAAAGPSARAVQAPPLPNSGGMMVAAGAMTMPAMNGMSHGGGPGASVGFQAEDDVGQQPADGGTWNWITSFFGGGTAQSPTPPQPPAAAAGNVVAEKDWLTRQIDSFVEFMTGPSGPPPAESERPASQPEMQRMERSRDEPKREPGKLSTYFYNSTQEGFGEANDMMTRVLPVFAAGVLIEVGGLYFGPEDLAIWGAIKAGGYVIRPLMAGGKQLLKNGKKLLGVFTKEGAQLTEKELKALFEASKALGAALETAAAAARGFKKYQCKECVAAIVKALRSKGVRAEIIEIRTLSRSGQKSYHKIFMEGIGEISDNGTHLAVRVGDVVFDNLHPDGILYELWLKKLMAPFGYMITMSGF